MKKNLPAQVCITLLPAEVVQIKNEEIMLQPKYEFDPSSTFGDLGSNSYLGCNNDTMHLRGINSPLFPPSKALLDTFRHDINSTFDFSFCHWRLTWNHRSPMLKAGLHCLHWIYWKYINKVLRYLLIDWYWFPDISGTRPYGPRGIPGYIREPQ